MVASKHSVSHDNVENINIEETEVSFVSKLSDLLGTKLIL